MKSSDSSRLPAHQLRQRVEAGQASQHAVINGIKVTVLMSQVEVASILGVSQMTVSNLERSALKKLCGALK